MGLVGGIRLIAVGGPSALRDPRLGLLLAAPGSLTPQAPDQQVITPAQVRWALYGPLSHALMRIASEKLYASV